MDMTQDTRKQAQHVSAPGEDFVFRDTAAMLRSAPYTEKDRTIAEANIAFALSEGASLDEEILRARQSLEKLEQRRMSVRRFEYMERGFLSPIATLPYEVLRHIFLLANEAGLYIYDDYVHAIPRVVSQVCSYWRLVAHSCAALWTDIKFMNESPVPQYEPLLQDCLKFSGRMPLSLHFGVHTSPKALGDQCIQVLGRCASRWKGIVVNEEKLMKALFSSVPKDSTLECLETLNLQNLKYPVSISETPKLKRLIVSAAWMSGHRNIRISMASAPSLVHLGVHDAQRLSTALTGVNWSKITKFEAKNTLFQPEEFVTILERMPNLVSLTIIGSTEATGTVVMAHLEELSTGDWQCLDANVFDNITAPRLKRLKCDHRIDFSSFPQFVNRSQCAIEEIELTGEWINTCGEIPALASVKTVSFDDPYDVSDSFYDLTYRSGPTPNDSLTGLENLYLTNINGVPDRDNEMTITDFIDMLKSRLRPQQTEVSTKTYLKSLRIEFLGLLDEYVAPLTEFVNSELVKSSGVRINISCNNLNLSLASGY